MPKYSSSLFLVKAFPKGLVEVKNPGVEWPKDRPSRISAALKFVVSKAAVHKLAVVRATVKKRFKFALNQIATRDAQVETTKSGKEVLLADDAFNGGRDWLLPSVSLLQCHTYSILLSSDVDWVYEVHLYMQVYRMPYPQLITRIREGLSQVNAQCHRLEKGSFESLIKLAGKRFNLQSRTTARNQYLVTAEVEKRTPKKEDPQDSSNLRRTFNRENIEIRGQAGAEKNSFQMPISLKTLTSPKKTVGRKTFGLKERRTEAAPLPSEGELEEFDWGLPQLSETSTSSRRSLLSERESGPKKIRSFPRARGREIFGTEERMRDVVSYQSSTKSLSRPPSKPSMEFEDEVDLESILQADEEVGWGELTKVWSHRAPKWAIPNATPVCTFFLYSSISRC